MDMKATDYVEQLDNEHRFLSRHVDRCKEPMRSDASKSEIDSTARNMKNSLTKLAQIELEIQGMIPFIDERGKNALVCNEGWERYVPAHLRGVRQSWVGNWGDEDHIDQSEYEFGFN